MAIFQGPLCMVWHPLCSPAFMSHHISLSSPTLFFSHILKYLQQKKLCYSVLSLLLGIGSLLSLLSFRYCLVNSYIFIIHVCSNVSSLGIFFWVLYSWSDFIAQLFLKMHYFSFKTLISVCDYLCNHVKSFCIVVCVIILDVFSPPMQFSNSMRMKALSLPWPL